jgi:hypothetical protein
LDVLERPLASAEDVLAGCRPIYALRHLRRFPIGTPSPAIMQSVVSLLSTARLSDPTLVIDQTGVGHAMVDMLADALRGQVSCLFFPMTISAGHAVTGGEDGCTHVPKKELVSVLQALSQTRRLRVAVGLPLAEALSREMASFRASIKLPGKAEDLSWRECEHDDLVLAVALAAWDGERTPSCSGQPLVLWDRGWGVWGRSW